MYVVAIAICGIVLTLPQPVFNWLIRLDHVLWAVAAATIAPALVAAFAARRAVRLLDRYPEDPGHGQEALARGMQVISTLMILTHGAILVGTQWMPYCQVTPLIGRWPGVAGTLSVVPFLLSMVLVWIAIYPADRAVRHIAVEVYLFRGRPVRPVWPLGAYVLYNLRHQILIVLIPLVLMLVARDAIELHKDRLNELGLRGHLPDMLLGAAAVLVAVLAPEMLRHVWITQRLPDGPLRDRLLAMCRTLGLRCREILVWRSGGMIVNAAVMGLVAPLRYVLITDGMLEQMEDRKIEAVFGHEAGHVKRHHIPYILLFAFTSGCLMTVVSVWIREPGLSRQAIQTMIAVGGVLLTLKWWLVFGWVSRRFERQADVYAVRTLAATGMACANACAQHGNPAVAEETAGAAPSRAQRPSTSALSDNRLCSSAAHVFGDTLLQVAALNGIPADARSWRHGSIRSRERLIHRLAADPGSTERFERLIVRLKAAILLAAVASALWAGWELQVWTLVGLKF